MTTKEKIIEAANRKSPYWDRTGGFANTDGEWCMTSTPEQFKEFLEGAGFVVIECRAAGGATAIATTACGLQIAWNGFCHRV